MFNLNISFSTYTFNSQNLVALNDTKIITNLPNFPPHISPGPFKHTRCPHLSRVHPQLQDSGKTSWRPSSQAGGSGVDWTQQEERRRSRTTIFIIFVLVEGFYIWRSESRRRESRRFKKRREQVGDLTTRPFRGGLETVSREEEFTVFLGPENECVHSMQCSNGS